MNLIEAAFAMVRTWFAPLVTIIQSTLAGLSLPIMHAIGIAMLVVLAYIGHKVLSWLTKERLNTVVSRSWLRHVIYYVSVALLAFILSCGATEWVAQAGG